MKFQKKNQNIELNQTLFLQLYNNFQSLRGAKFRIIKNEKLIRIDLLEEQVFDVGGPYHEANSLICNEFMI